MVDSNLYQVDKKIALEMDISVLNEYERVFKSIDKDKDGHVDSNELLEVFHSLGYREMKNEDALNVIKEFDINNNQKIEYQEFVIMMNKFTKLGMKEKFTSYVNKKGDTLFKVEGSGSYSTFSEEERTAYTKLINSVLCNDPDCKSLLPINPESNDLFPSLKNGVILCKLINAAVPGTIDERVINKKENMNIFLATENLRLAINASKAIGVKVIGIDHTTIQDQRYPLILGILWQIIKIVLLASINIKKYPQLIKLLNPGEELKELLSLPPEDILKRWFNYHLTKAGHPNKLTNFSSDIKNSEKYTILLNQLDPKQCDKSALDESDEVKRGTKVLANAKKIGVESYITALDIKNGNERLNLLFTAEIFNHLHGLEDLNKEEEEAYEKAKLLDDDVEGTREERAFRMWINSMGIDDVYVNNLYEDVRSGVLLLKVIDKIKPGVINWKKVDLAPKNPFAKLVNCNEAIDACKKIPLSIVSTSGSDVNEPNKKLILGVVWQLMRENTLMILGNKKENDILDWFNLMVPSEPKFTSFSDKRFSDSLVLIDLLAQIEPRAIDWDLVSKEDKSNEAIEKNAKYTISLARKLGATVFLVWEDITEIKPKMLLTFCAGLYEVHHLNTKLKNAKKEVSDDMKTNVGLDS